MSTGRTVSKFVRFIVDDSGGTLRNIPIDGISVLGLTYDEVDLTAFMDAVKGALPNHPDAPIEITGPVDSSAVQTVASNLYSGSYTVLKGIVGVQIPLALDVRFGIRAAWATNDPQFGISYTTANGYTCSAFTIDPVAMKYSTKFVLFPGSAAPAWGTTAET